MLMLQGINCEPLAISERSCHLDLSSVSQALKDTAGKKQELPLNLLV